MLFSNELFICYNVK